MNWIKFLLLLSLLFVGIPALAQETTPVVMQETNIPALLWAFLNSQVGVIVVATVAGSILGVIFKKQPSWQVLYDQHKGLIFDAVRHAEKAIPDGTANPGAQKADAALKFLLQFDPALAGKKELDIRKAITAAHDELKR